MASHFASLPLNFNQTPSDTAGNALAGSPADMLDGDTSTFWSLDAATGGVRFPLGGSSREFDAYYFVSQNVGGYTATGLTAQSAPTTVDGSAAAAASVQYAFHALPAVQTGTSADFNWTSRVDNGSPVRIYEFYVIKLLFSVAETDGFRQINQSFNFRGSQIKEALDGTRTRTRPLGNRGKWRIGYAMNVLSSQDSKILRLNEMFSMNPNFTHVVDFPAHRDRVFRAYLADDLRYSYISTFRGSGSVVQFTIEEV